MGGDEDQAQVQHIRGCRGETEGETGGTSDHNKHLGKKNKEADEGDGATTETDL